MLNIDAESVSKLALMLASAFETGPRDCHGGTYVHRLRSAGGFINAGPGDKLETGNDVVSTVGNGDHQTATG